MGVMQYGWLWIEIGCLFIEVAVRVRYIKKVPSGSTFAQQTALSRQTGCAFSIGIDAVINFRPWSSRRPHSSAAYTEIWLSFRGLAV